ncbi:MAG: NAD-dependent malic enzyme [Dehalococcoidia bacterium]|nr:MAG: NAD-dependent malic enzyme [Dehalococcoidia bacterium]
MTDVERNVKHYPDRTNPGAGYQLLLRLRMQNRAGMHGKVATLLGEHNANILDIDIAEVNPDVIVRDFIILCEDESQAQEIVHAVALLDGVEVQHASDRTFQLHRRGKIRVENKVHIRTNAELSHVYTPGVGRVSMKIHEIPDAVWSLTIKPNAVAIVTDGTAVLGLGDIGPHAAMPVMEGKSMLFKAFADIDAWPICLDTKDTEEIIKITKAISPGFGAILLEDISAPRCFEIEDRLRAELNIPVFHDDQHGTAVVVLAALMNSLKIVNKRPEDLKVCVLGVGAAGVACSKIMMNFGVKNVIGFDRDGAVYKGRSNLNVAKVWFAEHTNPEGFDGTIEDALRDADMFLGLSGPNLIKPEWVSHMAKDAIVFALANPVPEIMPDQVTGMARVIATGRSDFPNQINNVLCFPGLFRGALDAGALQITEEMKIVAARAIAESIPTAQLSEEYILPSVFNEEVVTRVSEAVAAEAVRTGNIRHKGSRIFI